MAQQLSPWLETAYGWTYGEGGWNSGMDSNLLKFSVMFDRNVDSIVTSLPPAVNGQVHYNTSDNRLYFAVGTAYFSTPVPKWFEFKDRPTGNTYQYNGSSASLIDSPSQLASRLDAVELTVSSLGTAAFQNVEDFATQVELDVVEGQAQGYTDVLREDLANSTDPAKGAGLVGRLGGGLVSDLFESGGAGLIPFGSRTVEDRLDDLPSILDGVGTTTQKFQAVFSAGGGAIVPAGAYSIDAPITGTQDVLLFFTGPTIITCTAPTLVSHVFSTSQRLKIIGGPVIIDCANKAYCGIYTPYQLPEISSVTVRNAPSSGWLAGIIFGGTAPNDYSGSTGIGRGYLDNCRAENCGSFILARGTGASSNTEFGLRNCSTDSLCGYTNNIFNLADIGYGWVHGGEYKGITDIKSAPNMTRAGVCEYIGGVYDGLSRGPTSGEGTHNVTMVGGISRNMDNFGISVDARITSDNSVPEIIATLDWTSVSCRRSAFIQASGVYLKSLSSINPLAGVDSDIRLTDAKNVRIGNITSVGAGSKVFLELGSGLSPTPGSSATLIGKMHTDSTNSVPFRLLNADCSFRVGGQKVISANYKLTWQDETIFVDSSAGAVDIDAPSLALAENLVGKVWTIKIANNTSNITITRDGGGSTAINGTSQYLIAAGGAVNREVKLESLGGGNYAVTVSV